MRREHLERELRALLARADFMVSEPHGLRSVSFDMVARREGLIIVVKCVQSVASMERETAREMIVLASTLGGAPLAVASHGAKGKLEDGVVFSRYGVPLLSLGSLKDLFVEGVPPYVFAGPGGLYVKVDSDVLRKAREGNVSIGELAEAAGVSRRAIQMYENGMGAMLEAALRLEKFLGRNLILPVDPLSYNSGGAMEESASAPEASGLNAEVFASLGKLGYSVYQTAHCPFDALTKERENLYVTGVAKDIAGLGEKGLASFNVAKIAGRQSVIFTRRASPRKNAGGSAVVGQDELKKVRDPSELKRLVRERGGR
ncbi:MAG: helix-turn-helix domain-containing protein [Methanobacteriota archaeon]